MLAYGKYFICLVLVFVAAESGAQARQLVATPVTTVRATRPDGSLVFAVLAGAARMPNGDIFVADAGEGQIIRFDSTGRELSRVGRKGQGPGEFGLISWLGRCASDSIFVWDVVGRRMSVVSENGEIARQTRFPAEGAGVTPNTLACSQNGMIAVLGWPKTGQPDRDGIARGTAPLAVFDGAGQLLSQIRDVPAGESVVTSGGVAPRPLGKRTSFSIGGGRLYLGTADSSSVLVFDLQGASRGAINVQWTRRRPSHVHKVRAVEPLVAFFPQGEARETMRKAMIDVAEPSELPPYSGLFATQKAGIWVETSHPGDELTRLEWYGAEERDRATVTLPGTATVLDVGLEFIIARVIDENAEESIVVYRTQSSGR